MANTQGICISQDLEFLLYHYIRTHTHTHVHTDIYTHTHTRKHTQAHTHLHGFSESNTKWFDNSEELTEENINEYLLFEILLILPRDSCNQVYITFHYKE